MLVHASVLSCVQLFATPRTVAHQAALFMGFPRQGYWRGLLFPSPGDLPSPGIKPASPALAGGFFTAEPPRKPQATLLLTLKSDQCSLHVLEIHRPK